MNKRIGYEMIFVTLLCLLFALLTFISVQAGNREAQPFEPETVFETVAPDISASLSEMQVVYAPSPSLESETPPPVEEWVCPLTDEDVELLALLTMAEAEGECEYGQRLVIDSVLNRMDSEHFPNTVHDVVYQKNQYSSITGERADHCWVKEELCELVRSELKERTDYDVVFFRTKHYHTFGIPLFQVGAHYFSKYG